MHEHVGDVLLRHHHPFPAGFRAIRFHEESLRPGKAGSRAKVDPMANDWDPHFTSIGENVKPDWDAAVAYIEGLSVEQLAELLEETDVSREIDSASEEHLPAARDVLRKDVAEFRDAVENGHPHMVRLWTRDVFVYVIDDREQSALWDAMPVLRWSGVLVAAGFDDTR